MARNAGLGIATAAFRTGTFRAETVLSVFQGIVMQEWLEFFDHRQWRDVAQPLWRISLIWLAALLLLRFMHKLIGVMRTHVVDKAGRRYDRRRLDTLANVFRRAATVILLALAGMLTLDQAGIAIAPILATAGVAGIAIGFGAQSLVKDFFTGFFLLLENQVSEGDLIEAAGKSGIVEEVNLRHLRVRDDDGSVHFIPNGIITLVTNRSREFAYAVIDVQVGRRHDLERICGALRDTAQATRADAALGSSVLGELDIEGVEKLEDASMTIRCRLKVLPLQQARVRRAFLARIKNALDSLET
ncbi:MAG TPA: mechanosensitive ion channel domain-containing protein [Paucimonas sp.]|nr:mechanosensitive ion channel domain-containing protein [Paucimonas sp.]